jgi:hypothetical protein
MSPNYIKVYSCSECAACKMFNGNFFCKRKYENQKRMQINDIDIIPVWCPITEEKYDSEYYT